MIYGNLIRSLSCRHINTDEEIFSVDIEIPNIHLVSKHFSKDDKDLLESYEINEQTIPIIKPFIAENISINWGNGNLKFLIECWEDIEH